MLKPCFKTFDLKQKIQKAQEDAKIFFLKNNQKMQTNINPFKNNYHHPKIIHMMQFRSSFNIFLNFYLFIFLIIHLVRFKTNNKRHFLTHTFNTCVPLHNF